MGLLVSRFDTLSSIIIGHRGLLFFEVGYNLQGMDLHFVSTLMSLAR